MACPVALLSRSASGSCMWRRSVTYSHLPLKSLRAPLLFSVSLGDLSDEDRKWHGKRSVDRTGIGPPVVLEDFDGQGGIVGKDDSGLLHPHKSGLTLGLAERAAGVDRDVGVIAPSDRSDRGKGCAHFQRHSREDELLSPGRLDRFAHLRVV